MFTHELVLNKKAVKGAASISSLPSSLLLSSPLHSCFKSKCFAACILQSTHISLHRSNFNSFTKTIIDVSLETLFKISPAEWKCCLHSQFDRGRTQSSAHLMGDHMPNLRVFAMFTLTRNLFIEFQRQNSLVLNLINIKIVN